jgi:release factor glutamine methyltransferase
MYWRRYGDRAVCCALTEPRVNTLKSTYEGLKKSLLRVYPDTAAHDARYILKARAGIDWVDIIANPDREITIEIQRFIYDDLNRYMNGEPLSRIYNVREFWGLEFKVTKDTLDPRPDTETLVRAVLNRYKDNPPERILDLGTGTGCILIALLTEWQQAKGVAVDCSGAALQVAQENALKHGVAGRIEFVQSHWCAAFENIDKGDKFDLVVSNPPYIHPDEIESLSPAVKHFDPILALTDGKNGLGAYETIFLQIKNVMKDEGRGFFEIGINQDADVARLARKALSRVEKLYLDSAGIPRVVEITHGDK